MDSDPRLGGSALVGSCESFFLIGIPGFGFHFDELDRVSRLAKAVDADEFFA